MKDLEKLFVNKNHYQRYLYAKKRAEEMNKYLCNKDYLVLMRYDSDQVVNYEIINGKFTFEDYDGNPVIELDDAVYWGWEWKNDLIYIDSKKEIDKVFNRFVVLRIKDFDILRKVKNGK